MPFRRVVPAVAAAALMTVTVACTSSGGGSTSTTTPTAPATPSTSSTPSASTPVAAAWSKQEAGDQLTAMLETQSKTASSVAVSNGAPFTDYHQAFVAVARACNGLVTGLRGGHWPAGVRELVTAFTQLQAEECTHDDALAAAPTAGAMRAVQPLPQDHAEKVFDARLALENALGL